MKMIHLLRHGKATRKFLSVDDFDRPLTEKGIMESHQNANELLSKGLLPETIISSTAARAVTTAVIFRRVLGLPDASLTTTDHLYEISSHDLIKFICGLNDHHKDVMLVGHNPSFSILAEQVDKDLAHIPTGGVMGFSARISKWAEFSPDLAETHYTILS